MWNLHFPLQDMKNQCVAVLSLMAVGLVVLAAAVPAKKSAQGVDDQQLLFLAKLLSPLRELSKRAGQLEGIISDAAQDNTPLAAELHKRQQQWEAMDYGWGGGRFGKRNSPQDAPKRYDMYGAMGRFGRDVDHVDADGQ